MNKGNKEKINVNIFKQINVKFFRLNKTKKLEKYGIRIGVLVFLLLIVFIILSLWYPNSKINVIKKQQERIDNCFKTVNTKINRIADTVNEIKIIQDSTFSDSISQNILDSINGLKKEINSNFKIVHSKINDLSFENQSNLDSLVNKGQLFEKLNQLERDVNDLKNQISKPFFSSDLFILTIFLLVAGFVLKKHRKSCFIAATVTGLSFICKMGIEGKLAFEPTLIWGNRCCCDTTYTPTTLPDHTNTPTTLLDTTLIIGPFKSGYDSLEHDGLTKLENAKALLSDSRKSFSEIMILGGVDKRPLRRQALLKFGDNLSLAQARANAIQQRLAEEVFSKKTNQAMPKFIILVNGANVYDDKDSVLFADSRCVKIIGKFTTNAEQFPEKTIRNNQ